MPAVPGAGQAQPRRRALAVLLGVLAFFLTGLSPAIAAPPFAVDQLLTDRADALGGDATQVQRALEAVADETGGTMNVVLVSGFDGVTAADWVEQVASQSDLGSSYLLLAIDVDGHTYEWWLGDTAPWDVAEVEQLLTAAAQPEVVAGHWADAVTAVAEGLRTGDIPAAASESGDDSSQWSTATTTAVIGSVVLVLLAAHQISRRTPARRQPTSRDTGGQAEARD